MSTVYEKLELFLKEKYSLIAFTRIIDSLCTTLEPQKIFF